VRDETVEVLALTASKAKPVDDVPVRATWDRLSASPNAILIDVRTRAEWSYVGLADLSALGKQPVLVEWLSFPENRVNPDFLDQLSQQLEALGADQGAELFFICRSGVRSRNAAVAAAAAGYEHCHNVADGFEGALDGDRHRGLRSGWKAEGLPWVQS
jgi:rhodanese-related sulfurtransferase